MPLGLRTLNKIENIIREEMNKAGGQEILMPALHPLENYIQTGRDKIDVLFHITSRTGKKMVLSQSHEEVVVPLVKKYINSYKDLPLAVYQIQTKFRNELRPKSGIFRGIEFLMKDLYSFHADENDFEKYYERMKKAYFNVFNRVGINKQTYFTYASGGTFSKYSHEFQTLTSVGEDKIHICEKCKVAINEEIIKEIPKCPECGNKKLRQEKAIEVGNIFSLKTKFSDAFNLKFKDKNGKEKSIIMGCYGIGLTRLLGTITELYNDKNGIIWPEEVAPFQVHLLCVKCQVSSVKKFADKVYDSLQKAGVEVLYDNRQDVSMGEKLADADLIGIPWRLVISERTGGKIEVKRRNERKTRLVNEKELIKLLRNTK